MRRAIPLVLRLYPVEWRRRYEDELVALLEESDISVIDVLDLLSWGIRRRAAAIGAAFGSSQTGGGPEMFPLAGFRPIRFALAGLVIVLPTASFTVLAVLKYVVGIPAPFDAVEPTVTPLVTHPLGETLLIVAPYAALLLAVAPVVRVRLAWRQMRVTGSVDLSAPALNVVVAILSAALVIFMALYWVAENA
jgi:hypothetical protein